jgi:hypothetical protein
MYRSWGDFASRLRRKIAAWAGSLPMRFLSINPNYEPGVGAAAVQLATSLP